MAAHAHEDSECGIFGDEVRTAVAHKRQGCARDWEQPHIHAHVDNKLREEIYRDARRHQRVEIVAATRSHHEYADNDDAEKAEKQEYAEKAPFLRIGGEDKVGLVFRQKLQF